MPVEYSRQCSTPARICFAARLLDAGVWARGARCAARNTTLDTQLLANRALPSPSPLGGGGISAAPLQAGRNESRGLASGLESQRKRCCADRSWIAARLCAVVVNKDAASLLGSEACAASATRLAPVPGPPQCGAARQLACRRLLRPGRGATVLLRGVCERLQHQREGGTWRRPGERREASGPSVECCWAAAGWDLAGGRTWVRG